MLPAVGCGVPLPRPRQWRVPTIRAAKRWATAAAGAVTVLVAFGGLVVRPGNAAIWAVVAGVGVAWVCQLWQYAPGVGRNGEVSLAEVGGATGLALPFSPARVRAARVGHAALVVAVAGLAVAVASRIRGTEAKVAVALLALLAVGAAALVARDWRSPFPRLVLTPDGVTLEWQGSTHSAAWADVRAIDPWLMWERYAPARQLVFVRRQDGSAIEVPADALGIDPVTAYWVLRHYAHHPLRRHELADERSVRRVLAEDLR